jgi:hypothetical protein
MEGKGFSRRVTKANLESFRALLRQAQGGGDLLEEGEGKAESEPTNPEVAKAEALFSGEPLKAQAPFPRPKASPGMPKRKKRRSAGKPPAHAPPVAIAAPANLRGPVLWRKVLEASDCERQKGHGTGGMRLVQVGWKEAGGKAINQNTYFRQVVFGHCNWTGRYSGKKSNLLEETYVQFDITVQGTSLGVRQLKVSDMQSRAAGQHNYTSLLHWTKMTKEIRDLNLTGKTLSLYGPPPGTPGPFCIIIA